MLLSSEGNGKGIKKAHFRIETVNELQFVYGGCKNIITLKEKLCVFCGPKEVLTEYQGKCWNGQ